jgi:hypothetical protein
MQNDYYINDYLWLNFLYYNLQYYLIVYWQKILQDFSILILIKLLRIYYKILIHESRKSFLGFYPVRILTMFADCAYTVLLVYQGKDIKSHVL